MKNKDNILFATLSMYIMQLFLASLTFMAIYLGMSGYNRILQIIVSILGTIAIDGIFSTGLMSAVKNYKRNKLQAGVILFVGIVSLLSSQIANNTLFSFKGGGESQATEIVKHASVNANVGSLNAELKQLKSFSMVRKAINTHREKKYRAWMLGQYGLGKQVRNEFYAKIPSSDRYKKRVRAAYYANKKAIDDIEKKIVERERLSTKKVESLASLVSTVTDNEKQRIKVSRESSMMIVKSITALNILFFIGIILLAFYLNSMDADGTNIKSIYKPFALLFVFMNNSFVGVAEMAFRKDFNGDGVIGFRNKPKTHNTPPNPTRERTQERTSIKDKPNRHMNRENTLRQPTMENATIGTIGIEEEDGGVLPSDLKSLLKGEFDERKIRAAIANVSSASGLRSRHSVSKINYHKAQFHKNPNSNVFWNLAVAYKWYSITKKDKRMEKTKEWIVKYLDI